MPKIKSKYFYLFLLISLFIRAKSQESVSTYPDTYLTTAAENNPGLQAKFSEYLAALEKVPQVGALPDPQVAFGYFIQPVETRLGPQQARISVSQMFPWFGTLGAKRDVATEMAKAKYEEFEEAKSRLFYDVKSTWYNIYFADKAIGIMKENIEILRTFNKLALIKIEAGDASSVDALRVEMEVLDLENQLYKLVDNYEDQKIAFNNLLNTENSAEIIIPDQLPNRSIPHQEQAVFDSILQNNHQLLSLDFKEASLLSQQHAARKSGAPQIKLGLDYIFIGESSNEMIPAGESGRDAIMLPMVGISVPLYRKKYTSMVKEAVILQESVQQQKADKANILENVYQKANSDYLDAQRRIELHKKQLELSQKALRILETEYANNGSKFEELLRMDRKVLMHSLELEKSRSDLNAAIAFITYLMGN